MYKTKTQTHKHKHRATAKAVNDPVLRAEIERLANELEKLIPEIVAATKAVLVNQKERKRKRERERKREK